MILTGGLKNYYLATFMLVEASDVRDKYVRDQRMFGTICNFATSKYNLVTYVRDNQRILQRIRLSRSAFGHELMSRSQVVTKFLFTNLIIMRLAMALDTYQ